MLTLLEIFSLHTDDDLRTSFFFLHLVSLFCVMYKFDYVSRYTLDSFAYIVYCALCSLLTHYRFTTHWHHINETIWRRWNGDDDMATVTYDTLSYFVMFFLWRIYNDVIFHVRLCSVTLFKTFIAKIIRWMSYSLIWQTSYWLAMIHDAIILRSMTIDDANLLMSMTIVFPKCQKIREHVWCEVWYIRWWCVCFLVNNVMAEWAI